MEVEVALDRLEDLCRLAEAAQNGRPECLEALLRESAGIVHAIVRARFGESLAAEEAAAEALTRIARDLKKLRNARAYPRWAARIAGSSESTPRTFLTPHWAAAIAKTPTPQYRSMT